MVTDTPANPAVEKEANRFEADDDPLLMSAKAGDGRAFDELSGRHSRKIQLKVYRILGNWEDAEDVMQESLLKAFRHLSEFRGTSSFSTWLTRIAINSALMLLRKRRVRREMSLDRTEGSTGDWEVWDLPDSSPDPECHYADREANALLHRAIRRLPLCLRTAVELYHSEDWSTAEIAESLGISVASTKSRLYRARQRLSTSLSRCGQSTSVALQRNATGAT